MVEEELKADVDGGVEDEDYQEDSEDDSEESSEEEPSESKSPWLRYLAIGTVIGLIIIAVISVFV